MDNWIINVDISHPADEKNEHDIQFQMLVRR
jgi:hypothetical protein